MWRKLVDEGKEVNLVIRLLDTSNRRKDDKPKGVDIEEEQHIIKK